mgnify:CR=1 FL=1
MSQLADLFKDLEVPRGKLEEVAREFLVNPMMAMGLVQELNLAPELLQEAMSIIMADPSEIGKFARALGVSAELADKAETKATAIMANKPSD